MLFQREDTMDKTSLKLLAATCAIALSGSAATAGQGNWKLMDIGGNINTEYHEAFSVMTADGMTLYFSSNRPNKNQDADIEDGWIFRKDGSETRYDIYVSHRRSPSEPWGVPALLPDTINSSATDHSPVLSEDGHYLIFASDRPGGCGSLDLYASYRADITDDQAWEPAKHLGCQENGGVNGAGFDSCPILMGDKIYFTSAASTDLGTLEFKRTSFSRENMTASMAEILPNSTPHVDAHFDPFHGLIWAIYPEGGVGGSDLWQFENAHTEADPAKFVNPVAFAAPINTPAEEHMPSATADGRYLAFASDREGGRGGMDIFQAKRD